MSNVSSVVDYFATANEGFTTTLASPGTTSGATTVPLAGTTGLTNGTVFVGIIEPGATNQQVFTGTVDTGAGTIDNVVWTRGTNVAHTAGVAIVDYTTGTAFNMLTAGILKQHTQTGTHTGLTTDTLVTSGNATVGGNGHIEGTTTLDGAVGGAGFSLLTMATPYKFSVYRAGSGTGTGGFSTFICDTKLFDTGSNYSTTTGLFTAPVNGFYFFTGYAQSTLPGGVGYGASLNVTSTIGGNRTESHTEGITGNGTFGSAASASGFIQLAANDTVGFGYYNSSNSYGVGLSNNGFQGFLFCAT